MTIRPLVLVTGVSGFLASHVALQLFNSGYTVRGTVRSSKLGVLQETLGKVYPFLELVSIDDISTGDLTDALKGVKAVIHVASPLASATASPKDKLKTAIEGTLNVLRQAVGAGIRKVVLTSSFGANLDPELKRAFQQAVITEKDWGEVDEEELLNGRHNALYIYIASKILAERAAWKFAEEHPILDLASINPPFLYGPYAEHFPLPNNRNSLGSNGTVYRLLGGAIPPLLPPHFCDVRDAARAHVVCLQVPEQKIKQAKRFLVSGGPFNWKEAIHYLSGVRPELKGRFPALDDFTPLPQFVAAIDTTRAKDILHMTEYIDWRQTLENTVDDLLRLEKAWDE